MKAERLLGIQVPRHLGGESASITEIAELCSMLGQVCAASAMVFAMHHIKLSSLVEHGADSEWHRGFMRRIAAEQLLIASATTEGGIGGNLRNSICAVEVDGDTCRLERMRPSFPTARMPTPFSSPRVPTRRRLPPIRC